MQQDGIWCGTLRRFVFSFMCSDPVAREVREYHRTEHNPIFFYCTERTPPSQFEILLFRIFSKTQEVSCNVFTVDHQASFRLFVEDNVKDDTDTYGDVVERDVDVYATQNVLSRTLNVKLLDVEGSKTKQNDKRQRQQQQYCTTEQSGAFEEVEHEHTQIFLGKLKASETDKLHENRYDESNSFFFPDRQELRIVEGTTHEKH